MGNEAQKEAQIRHNVAWVVLGILVFAYLLFNFISDMKKNQVPKKFEINNITQTDKLCIDKLTVRELIILDPCDIEMETEIELHPPTPPKKCPYLHPPDQEI